MKKSKLIIGFLVICIGVWQLVFVNSSPIYPKHLLNKECVIDHAQVFSAEQQNELEEILKNIWDQYQGTAYIFTDYKTNSFKRRHEIYHFLKTDYPPPYNKPEVLLLLKDQDSYVYHLSSVYLKKNFTKHRHYDLEETVIYASSSLDKDDFYLKLLSAVNQYSTHKQSEKTVTQDAKSAAPAFTFIVILSGSILWLGYLLLKTKKH